MTGLLSLLRYNIRRSSRDSFLIGYHIIFPIVMIVLLGYLSSESYGTRFTGYQYYSVVMLPFCIAMAVITAAYAAKDDANKKTAVRFLFAPVPHAHIVLAKLISCTLIISCFNLMVLVFTIFVFRLPAGAKLIPVTLLLAAETFAVCAIGLYIGFGMKNFILIKNVINIPICIAAIAAGAFFPLGTINPVWKVLIRLSPLTWVNRGMFLCIYDGNSDLLWKTTIAAVVIGLLFTVLAVRLFKKEEFIHGDLPGYEK